MQRTPSRSCSRSWRSHMRKLFFALAAIIVFILYLAQFANAQTNQNFRARFAPFDSSATGARLLRLTPTQQTVITNVLAVQAPCPSPQPGVLCADFSTLASPGDTIRFRLCQSNTAGESCTGCGGVDPCDTPDRFATLPTPTATATATPTSTRTVTPVATTTPTRSATPTPTPTRLAPPILHGVDPSN